ncbi:hypothetical protein [Jiangella mangrovi]|uniref:Uncharacterized protein n=1 Tax=Jiangella mangrovi TaxID=1524084 RepID=A0A7W9GRZ8_9ACTN|nr:hypothetical protein [Jiangella mangrovi]MBB5788753.1 hypothetical protein [Jiangella mangrovi]
MTLILAFIAAHMDFLWREARYRIVGSEVSTSNGGDALLLVESALLRLRFVSDRQQLLLDFQPAATGSATEWYTIDLVRRLFLKQRETSSLLDESYAEFLRVHLAEIEERFSPDAWATTRSELRQLMRKRSKEMFG